VALDNAAGRSHTRGVGDPLRRFAIVLDFDGTILPSTPWDSEQTLLLARMESGRPGFPLARRLYCRLVAYGDRRGWLGSSFKSHYIRLLRGTERELVDEVAVRLADRISSETRRTFAELQERGHRLIIASCGTADLSERILGAAGVLHHFEALLGNRFVFARGKITGMQLSVPSPRAKLQIVRASGLSAESTVVVGDGPTDLPLLAWAGVPVVVAPNGARWPPRVRSSCSFITSISQIVDILRRHGG
jgi:phosphoserine phosphatase